MAHLIEDEPLKSNGMELNSVAKKSGNFLLAC
jgi:hypothetical protein